MSTPEEKNEICEKAFKSIYPSCEHKDNNFLERLKDILGNDIAERIKNFNRYSKPVLFISDNISLIMGAVAYLWHTHGQVTPPRVLSCSGVKEDEVLTMIEGDWIEPAFTNLEFYTELCGILFLKDLNPYENILKRLWSIVDKNKGCSYIRHEHKTRITKEGKNFGILVIGMGDTSNLPQGLLDRFEVIRLETEKQSKAKPKMPRGKKRHYVSPAVFNEYLKETKNRYKDISLTGLAKKVIQRMKADNRFLDNKGKPLYTEKTIRKKALLLFKLKSDRKVMKK